MSHNYRVSHRKEVEGKSPNIKLVGMPKGVQETLSKVVVGAEAVVKQAEAVLKKLGQKDLSKAFTLYIQTPSNKYIYTHTHMPISQLYLGW